MPARRTAQKVTVVQKAQEGARSRTQGGAGAQENDGAGNKSLEELMGSNLTGMNLTLVPLETKALKTRLAKSPGGTDYIVTPGRHKISMTEFLASFDEQSAENDSAMGDGQIPCPLLQATTNYMELMHLEWLEREKSIEGPVFLLSFGENVPMEEFRQMAIQAVFNYAAEHRLHEKTVHLSALNISRLIYAAVRKASTAKALTHEMFGCTVIAALRHAVKSDESYEKSDRFRLEPAHVWRASPFLAQWCLDKTPAKLNAVEAQCLQTLDAPNNPPLAPEFFDRYLQVGQWPDPVLRKQYRELGAYLMGLALFSSSNAKCNLKGTPGSRLAAAALVLAIKVINTDNNNPLKYEFWPARLQHYTGFTVDILKPAIRGLAYLLRNKPQHSVILEKYYTKWAEYDWN